jgi:hypothetical protein
MTALPAKKAPPEIGMKKMAVDRHFPWLKCMHSSIAQTALRGS